MTSVDDTQKQSSKKLRTLRACDVCRRRKIRCDGPQATGSRCSNCATSGLDCTYLEASQKRSPPKAYIRSLEQRLQKMEKLLDKLVPGLDLSEISTPAEGDNEIKGRGNRDSFPLPYPDTNASDIRITPPTSVCGTNMVIDVSDLDPSDDEYAPQALSDNMRFLSADPQPSRFFGKSSGFMLIQNTIDLKKKYAGDDRPTIFDTGNLGRRPEFWCTNAWEMQRLVQIVPEFQYPPSDLVDPLIDFYMEHVNAFYPLFHEPTFRKEVASGLHLRDHNFACVLLLVCACGSRWSDDPRVLVDKSDSFQSAGWKWFNQVHMVRKSYLCTPCLYDLQLYVLTAMFLQGSSAPQACWTTVGIGLRVAQDVGAHRAKVYGSPLTKEDELWKRAFWVLVTLDRVYSSALGRSCAIQEEDFDLDMPTECDDEYWDHTDPGKAFKQPSDKPSKISAFNCYIKLNQILAFALRTIYCINKSKVSLGFVGQEWEQRIVAELDSEMNKWIDSIPSHLRWNPNQGDSLFFRQSTMLYTNYYNLQIQIHRPFIVKSRKLSPLSYPSLAICANAARSLSHTVEAFRTGCEGPFSPHMIMGVFGAALVLLLNMWGNNQNVSSVNTESDMNDLCKCIMALKECDRRWYFAGKVIHIILHLASTSNLSLPGYLTHDSTDARGTGRELPATGTSSLSSGVCYNNHDVSTSATFIPPPDLTDGVGLSGLYSGQIPTVNNAFLEPVESVRMDFPAIFPAASSSETNAVPYSNTAFQDCYQSVGPTLQGSQSAMTGDNLYSSQQQPQMVMNEDVMGLWSEMTDWESYISSVLGSDHYPSSPSLN